MKKRFENLILLNFLSFIEICLINKNLFKNNIKIKYNYMISNVLSKLIKWFFNNPFLQFFKKIFFL